MEFWRLGDGVVGFREGVVRLVGFAKDWGCRGFPCFGVVFQVKCGTVVRAKVWDEEFAAVDVESLTVGWARCL